MRFTLPLLVLAACGPPAPDTRADKRGREQVTEPDDSPFSLTGTVDVPDPTMEVGDGDVSHQPCDPGDDTTIVFGGQGGFHLEVSGIVSDTSDLIGLYVDATRLDTGEVIASNGAEPSYLRLSDHDGASGWFAGERAFLHDNALVNVCPLDGLTIELCARAWDLNDPSLEAAGCVELVARMHPDNLYMCGG